MEKPVNLRQPTWEFLLQQLGHNKFDEKAMLGLAKNLYEVGITSQPNLLQNTIITLTRDVEYKITPEAARAICANDELIVLRRLDGQETSVARATIIDALRNGCEFDQMEEAA